MAFHFIYTDLVGTANLNLFTVFLALDAFWIENNILQMNKNTKDKTDAKSELTELSDYDLAQKAAAGDVAAFEQIYWQHHRRVFGVCLRMTKNVTEAEDVTQ